MPPLEMPTPKRTQKQNHKLCPIVEHTQKIENLMNNKQNERTILELPETVPDSQMINMENATGQQREGYQPPFEHRKEITGTETFAPHAKISTLSSLQQHANCNFSFFS